MKPKEAMGLRTWIEIDRQALKNNYNSFRRLLKPTCLLMAVVKSNAYGHGLLDFANLVVKLGADWLGVDSAIEAESLRKAGFKSSILVLGYTLPEKIPSAAQNRIAITIADFSALKAIKSLKSLARPLRIHLKIDTGMHRQGFLVEEVPALITYLKKYNLPVIIEGLYTHFSSAKDPSSLRETKRQIKEFKKVILLFEEAGFNIPLKHAAATGGTMIFPESHFNMVRVGIGLYGLWPSQETQKSLSKKIKLKPVLSWKSVVAQIKDLPKGGRTGYDLTEKLSPGSKIAVLPVGYWHGLPRALSSVGRVLINGQEAKIVGRVSMSMICFDITKIKNVSVGDQVVLIGKSGRLSISAQDLADLNKTINYEIVTRLNPLIKRVVV
ncbi:MAG: alanine racemase [Patescibacteria group bacterium]|nr:MAG: alanine racemase [Patescibacteria group bacterium]